MSYQRRVLILNLALVVIGLGTTVGCRAEEVATPRAVSGAQNATLLLCAVVLSRCDPAVLTSQTTAQNAGRQSSKVRPPQLASGRRDTNTGWHTSNGSVSGRNVNFSVASTGADTDANTGRLALNVTLDSYYHGAIYNSQAPFEPMQVSLNYIRAW
jgi:hypothetical protein